MDRKRDIDRYTRQVIVDSIGRTTMNFTNQTVTKMVTGLISSKWSSHETVGELWEGRKAVEGK